ncbi:MAG: hypothetical protein P8Y91_10380, partial [Desulfuromonadales bacterium]
MKSQGFKANTSPPAFFDLVMKAGPFAFLETEGLVTKPSAINDLSQSVFSFAARSENSIKAVNLLALEARNSSDLRMGGILLRLHKPDRAELSGSAQLLVVNRGQIFDQPGFQKQRAEFSGCLDMVDASDLLRESYGLSFPQIVGKVVQDPGADIDTFAHVQD